MNQVNSALKTGHFNDETDSMQGTWYSQVHSQPAQIMFSGKYSQRGRIALRKVQFFSSGCPNSFPVLCSANGCELRRSFYQRITAITSWRCTRRSQKAKTQSFGWGVDLAFGSRVLRDAISVGQARQRQGASSLRKDWSGEGQNAAKPRADHQQSGGGQRYGEEVGQYPAIRLWNQTKCQKARNGGEKAQVPIICNDWLRHYSRHFDHLFAHLQRLNWIEWPKRANSLIKRLSWVLISMRESSSQMINIILEECVNIFIN